MVNILPTNQVNGTSFPGEHLTGTMNFFTVRTTVNITPNNQTNILADEALGIGDDDGDGLYPFAESQLALELLVETFSTNTQPIIMGSVNVTHETAPADLPSYTMGGAVAVPDVFGPPGYGNSSQGGPITDVEVLQAGTGFTAVPTVSFLGNGSGATATAQLAVVSAVVTAGGTGYVVGDVLTVSGGTFVTAATLTVSAVLGGVVTAVTVTSGGLYTALPANPVAVTGGHGTGATFTVAFGLGAIVVTAGGSGYTTPVVLLTGGAIAGTIPVYTITFVNEHDLAWDAAAFLDAVNTNVYVAGFVNTSPTTANNISAVLSGQEFSSAFPGSFTNF
jgi:hypothetical protein